MTHCDTIVEILERGHAMLGRTLADFTDADMLVRPCDHANHANWMLGHLCRSESFMLNACGGTPIELPAGFAEKYAQSREHEADVTEPLDKETLASLFAKVRGRTIEHVKSIKDADLSREIPSPFAKGMNTTVAFMLHMPALHLATHVGQMQVIRRKLGKPILF